jgi:hypothetical protein
MGGLLIALGCLVAIFGLAVLTSLIRRTGIPAALVLALIALAFAGAWLLFAQGRRTRSIAPWMTCSGGPYTHRIDPSFPELDFDVKDDLNKFRQRHGDVSELVAEELRRTEIHKLEAEALSRTHESLVISEEGPVVVLAPTPLPPSLPYEAVGPATVHTLTQQYLRQPWLGRWGIVRGGLVWNLVMGLSIAALLFVAYIFLDASTRGHFTWSLRILSVLVLVGIFATMAALRLGL